MKKLIILLLLIFTLILLILNIKNFKHQEIINIIEDKITFNNFLLETKQSLPRLFIQSPLILNTNAKYSYSIFNNLDSGLEFIRIDKKIIQTGTVWFDNVTAFYTFDKQTNQYKRVLVSSKEQNNARFPQTNIINPDNLTVKFFYDVSRPDQCYGYGCLSFWADFYKWDSKKNVFKLVNQEYKNFYQDLYKQYEEMNKKGCSLEDVENKGLITFEDVYKNNNTNYCKGSTREELNKFWDYKNKIKEQLESSNSINYICENNKKMSVKIFEEQVSVKLDDNREFTLKNTTSASGVRYTSEDGNVPFNESKVFWMKGSTAFFEENGVITYKSCVDIEKKCDTITKNQALNIVKNLPEVKNYLKIPPTNVSQSVIDITDGSGSILGFNIWSVHVYSAEKESESRGHSATFNWYSVDKCTGNIKCSFSEYDNKGKLIKVSDKYPCD